MKESFGFIQSYDQPKNKSNHDSLLDNDSTISQTIQSAKLIASFLPHLLTPTDHIAVFTHLRAR